MLELNIVAQPAAPAAVKSVRKYKIKNNHNKKKTKRNNKKQTQQQHQPTEIEKTTTLPKVSATKVVEPPESTAPIDSTSTEDRTVENSLEPPKADTDDDINQGDNGSGDKADDDEEERAKHAEYLAKFHPRIHELDRKSGARKAAVPASQSSKHLFEMNDDDEVVEADEGHVQKASVPNAASSTNATSSHAAATKAAVGPWDKLQLHPSLLTVLNRQSLSRPTTIQRRAIPFLLQSHVETATSTTVSSSTTNLLIQSETGSGKTLAYLLPLLQNLMHEVVGSSSSTRQSLGTKCIILVPTRELALQIFQVVQSFCNHLSSQFFATSSSSSSSDANTTTNNEAGFHLVAGCLSGGEKRKSEKARLRKGIHILVATPGRLLDHLNTTTCFSWSGLRYLVLDEADRLVVDMHDVIQQIVEKLQNASPAPPAPASSLPHHPPRDGTINNQQTSNQTLPTLWQTILVSATVTPKVQALAQDLLRLDRTNTKNAEDWTRHWHWIKGASGSNSNSKGPTEDSMDNDDDAFADLTESTPRQLSHIHLTVSAKFRLSTLIAFLVQCVQRQERVVVFMSTCDGVDFHHALFQSMACLLPQTQHQKQKPGANGHEGDDSKEQSIFGPSGKVFKLHGNMPHPDRQVIMRQFTKTTAPSSGKKAASILLATDVAARGLNLPHIDWIVQYDAPMEVSEYVHRAGRAARAGQAGHTLLFLLPSERGLLDVLQAKGVGVMHQQQAAHGMTALSLASVLEQAARVCLPPTTLDNTNSRRLGETFCSEIHRQIEECIWQDTKAKGNNNDGRRINKRQSRTKEDANTVSSLSDMARAAFLSYMRAYPTKEKAIRPIFSVRALHVGHVAKSFGLKEAPTALAKQHRRHNEGQDKKSTSQRRESELQADNNGGGKKRNAALSFERKSTPNASSGQYFKKQKTMERPNLTKGKTDLGKRSPMNKKQMNNGGGKFSSRRAALMARATKLQQNGMDAF